MTDKQLGLPTASALRGCREKLHQATDCISELLTRPAGPETAGRIEFVVRHLLTAVGRGVEAMRYHADEIGEHSEQGR
jgi:hypothetical protein